MFGARLLCFSRDRLLIWCVVLTLLLMQGLRVHVHTFTDHEALHGHDHAVELHVGGMPTDSGHDPDDEIGLAKPAILKIKTAHADSVVLPIVAVLLLVTLAVTGRVPWRPGRFFHPAPGGHVRTPPLRAPPV